MLAFQQAFEAAVKEVAALGIEATLNPVSSQHLFPRGRRSAKDAITVAERQDSAASKSEPEPEPGPEPGPEPEAGRTSSAALALKAALGSEAVPEPEPEPARETAPVREPEPAAPSREESAESPRASTPFPDERPGGKPKPPSESEVPDPGWSEPEVTAPVVVRPHGKGSRSSVVVLLIVGLLAGAGVSGYALWRHFQTPAASNKGTLVVDVQPKGAMIRIDNEPTGTLSTVRRELKVGSHRVTISKPGFDTIDRWVRIRPGKRTSLALDLLPSSRPAADAGTAGRPAPVAADAAAARPPPTMARPSTHPVRPMRRDPGPGAMVAVRPAVMDAMPRPAMPRSTNLAVLLSSAGFARGDPTRISATQDLSVQGETWYRSPLDAAAGQHSGR